MVKSVGVAAALTKAAQADDKDKGMAVINAVNSSGDLMSDGLTALGKAGRQTTIKALQSGARIAEISGKILSKLNAVVSSVFSGIDAVNSYKDAFEDPNTGNIGGAVGNTFTFVGSVASSIPGGQALGGALIIAGTLINKITEEVQENIDENALKSETEELLKTQLPENPEENPTLTKKELEDAAHNLACADVDWKQIADGADLNEEQVVRLAALQPHITNMCEGDFYQVAEYSGLTGDRFVNWAVGLSEDAVDLINQKALTRVDYETQRDRDIMAETAIAEGEEPPVEHGIWDIATHKVTPDDADEAAVDILGRCELIKSTP